MLSEKNLDYLAELSRMELKTSESKKLLADLEKIIDYFNELKSVDTKHVQPMTGGTTLQNVLRKDDSEDRGLNKDLALEQFPEKHDGFLKIPPVFGE